MPDFLAVFPEKDDKPFKNQIHEKIRLNNRRIFMKKYQKFYTKDRNRIFKNKSDFKNSGFAWSIPDYLPYEDQINPVNYVWDENIQSTACHE